MAQKRIFKKGGKGGGNDNTTPTNSKANSSGAIDQILEKIEMAESDAVSEIYGDATGLIAAEQDVADNVTAMVHSVVRQISRNTNTGGSSNIESMARLTQDSLLNTEIPKNPMDPANREAGAKRLIDALQTVENATITEMFNTERTRLEDYLTYQQIYDFITQASEAIQTYADNIISPDDFSKRDLNVYYEPAISNTDNEATVRANCKAIIKKYDLEDKVEDAILNSLYKGDFFIAIMNLRQELESHFATSTGATKNNVLNEGVTYTDLHSSVLLNEKLVENAAGTVLKEHVPITDDNDVRNLLHLFENSSEYKDAHITSDTIRGQISEVINEYMVFKTNGSVLREEYTAQIDIPTVNQIGSKRKAEAGVKAPKLDKINGSIIKMYQPENVIKLYQNDVLFGYYCVDYVSGKFSSTLPKKGSSDTNSNVANVVNQSISSKLMGSTASDIDVKENILTNIIGKTLVKKLGIPEFLNDNPKFAIDAYNVLKKAKNSNKQARMVFISSDQMVHFTPDGATGYGDSIFSRVKFIAKLYLGAMTNAFMRNSLRRAERLAWFIDVGSDNDADNSIQSFIRTIKQKEVKFSNLKDISTVINQIGEFHDFYIPTYNGERPVDVETLNMGNAAEVDNAYLEFLRKAIISGMSVPASFLGYSEEIAFAKSLSMENGRFLRRVVRKQKHYSKSATKVLTIVYRNEFQSLEEIMGIEKPSEEDQKVKKPKPKNEDGSENDDEKDSEDQDEFQKIKLDDITVRFPIPSSLNLTNLSDAITQTSSVLDFIVDNVSGSTEDEVLKNEFRILVVKDLMPQINWDRYTKMFDEAKASAMRKKIPSTVVDNVAPTVEGDEE